MLQSTNLAPHVASPFTKLAFDWTAGYKAAASLPSTLYTGGAFTDRLISMRSARDGATSRGVVIIPTLQADATDDVDYKLWGLWGVKADQATRTLPSAYVMGVLGSGVFTAGTATGAASTPMGTSDKFCDTVTWTKSTSASTYKGPGGAIFDAYQAADAQVYSPADNTFAGLIVPDIGGLFGLAIEMAGAADELLNALVGQVT